MMNQIFTWEMIGNDQTTIHLPNWFFGKTSRLSKVFNKNDSSLELWRFSRFRGLEGKNPIEMPTELSIELSVSWEDLKTFF